LYGPAWGPAAGANPKQLVVLCHGVGADGNDLIDLAPVLAGILPHALFIAPHGPEPYDGGPTGRQWFSLGNRDLIRMTAGVRHASIALNGFIDGQLAAHRIADYVLAGFSQGAMTALFTGLRRAAAPRGIIALSGALLDPGSLAAEIRNRAPVLLGHGELDGVVPASASRQTEAVLRANNVPVETVFSPNLGHGIDETILGAAVGFLKSLGLASA
jgi:phospholipase/carboxylesterase